MPSTHLRPTLRAAGRTARRWAAGGTLLLGAALAGGCSDSPFGPESVAGSYDLTAIDGAPLPYTTQDAQTRVTYTDGFLTLGADQRFEIQLRTQTTDFRTGAIYTQTDGGAGTYTLSGNRITATVTDAYGGTFVGTETGTVSGSTVDIAGLTFVRR